MTAIAYADASALVKLVIPEAETPALRVALAPVERLSTSEVGVVELMRAARRGAGATGAAIAGRLIDDLQVILLNDGIRASAGLIDPPRLKTLDAIHLATTLAVGAITRDFYCYDRRLCEAAAAAGLNVLSPGS